MSRKSLFILLCVGVIVRSTPAQDYLRSRYTSRGLRDANSDLPTPYDVVDIGRDDDLPRYREDFERKTYSERTQQRDLVAPPRTVRFYRDDDRPASRPAEFYDDRVPERDQQRHRDDRHTTNRHDVRRPVADRDDINRFPRKPIFNESIRHA